MAKSPCAIVEKMQLGRMELKRQSEELKARTPSEEHDSEIYQPPPLVTKSLRKSSCSEVALYCVMHAFQAKIPNLSF